MFTCYYCCERERVGYWSSWCEPCANLRRMLLIYSPDKCCDILKRTLTRDEHQISYKISQEVKKIVNKDIIENTINKETQEEDPNDVAQEEEEVQEKKKGRSTGSPKHHTRSTKSTKSI